jgi:hypothetical protein
MILRAQLTVHLYPLLLLPADAATRYNEME